MITLDIQKMPLNEKLETMERLWASLAGESAEALPSPAWHGDIIMERRQLLKSGKAKFSPLSQVKKRLSR